MLSIQFLYTENGKKKTSLDEHQRRVEIMEHNKRLNEMYPVYQHQESENEDYFECMNDYYDGL